jgi:hypothetical protein
MKTLNQIAHEWWQKQTTLSADIKSFEAGYRASSAWKPISEYDFSQKDTVKQYRDVIMKTVCGRIFRGYLDEHGQAWEFDGFDAGFGRGSSYVLVRKEPIESFKEMD